MVYIITCTAHAVYISYECDAYTEPLSRINLNHISEKLLCTSRDIGGNMKLSHLHFLQQLPKIIVIKWQSTLKTEQQKMYMYM